MKCVNRAFKLRKLICSCTLSTDARSPYGKTGRKTALILNVGKKLSGKPQNPSDFRSVIGRVLRNKRAASYMESRPIHPSAYDLVSETNPIFMKYGIGV